MAYIGNTDSDRQQMLSRIGLSRLEELFNDIPERHRFPALDLPDPASEFDILKEIDQLALQNHVDGKQESFLGAGAYNHFIPSVIDALSGRGEFATAYTPYQAEASQGTVQAIFEYQCMVADLLEMDVVNASHYDGATAMAEAAIMAVRVCRKRTRVVFSGSIHPEYLQVCQTYLEPQGIEIVVVGVPETERSTGPTPEDLIAAIDENTACLLVQNPDFLGEFRDLTGLAEQVHNKGALLALHTDPISCGLFHTPGYLDADIATAEGQPLGIPLSFGGPYLGVFACKHKHVRKMPGRLAGETVDTAGKRGYVLTLNTREQHIRREKATSNICTNQGLMALRASIYLATMGPVGLKEVATLCYQKANYAATQLAGIPGCTVVGAAGIARHFQEFVVKLPVPADEVVRRAAPDGMTPGLALSRYYPQRTHELLIAVTETNTRAGIDRLVDLIQDTVKAGVS